MIKKLLAIAIVLMVVGCAHITPREAVETAVDAGVLTWIILCPIP